MLSVIVGGILLFHVLLGELSLVFLHLSVELDLTQFDEELYHVAQVLLIVNKSFGDLMMSLSIDYIRCSWPATSIWLDSTPSPSEVVLKFPDTILLSLL